MNAIRLAAILAVALTLVTPPAQAGTDENTTTPPAPIIYALEHMRDLTTANSLMDCPYLNVTDRKVPLMLQDHQGSTAWGLVLVRVQSRGGKKSGPPVQILVPTPWVAKKGKNGITLYVAYTSTTEAIAIGLARMGYSRVYLDEKGSIAGFQLPSSECRRQDEVECIWVEVDQRLTALPAVSNVEPCVVRSKQNEKG